MDYLVSSIIAFISILLLVVVNHYSTNSFIKVLFNGIVLFESISNILIFQNKIPWPITLLVSVVSLWFLFKLRRKNMRTEISSNKYNKYIKLLTFDGYFLLYSFYLGLIIGFVSIFSEYLFFDGNFSSNLAVSLFISLIWLSYLYIPKNYSYERDFSFFFFHFLFFFLVFPRLLAKYLTDTAGEVTPNLFEDFFVYNFLGKPVYFILTLLGQDVWISGNSIFYIDTTTNLSAGVIISSGCSGLYSVMIFMCAFLSFALMIEKILWYDFFSFLIIGLFTSYIANLFRMAIIIMVGHYWGSEALDFTHSNLGWIIFAVWLFIFWSLLTNFFYKDFKIASQ